MSARQGPGPGAGWRDLQGRWRSLPLRHRALAATITGLAMAALLWWFALAPALATLRAAPSQQQALDAQLLRMRTLQAQAQQLQTMPRMGREEAQRALEAAVREHLGDGARLAPSGEGMTLSLAHVPGDALARWLVQARVAAATLPTEARLERDANGFWDGSLVLALPPR